MSVLLTYDPLIADYVYRPIVPFGGSLLMTGVFDGGGDVQCDRIIVSQDDVPWFEMSRLEPITSMSKGGISCDLTIGKQDVTLRITNGNRGDKPIILRVTPGFTKGLRAWRGKDPQIVLPPEKVFDDAMDELQASG